jgi:hypothetical protein
MNKKFFTLVLLCVTVISFLNVNAQADSSNAFPTYRVGIFAPLYLDSMFSNGNFKFKQGIPKSLMPSIDFIQGAQIALDSMRMGKENIEASIYDTRSYTRNIPYLINNKNIDSLDLIIGSVKDADYKQLADFALAQHIPFISATYPNDGGITSNPFTVIINSTLKAHCEAIYSYLLQNHGTDQIFLCRKNGSQEDKVAAYFKALNEQDGKPLLPIQILNAADSLPSVDLLKPKLNSYRKTVIIGGSLDEDFASSLATACYTLHDSTITLIGMPNWDGFASLHKKDIEGLPVYFTSPYFNAKLDNYSKMLTAAYLKKFKIKPSDMAYKGFETVYLFTRLLSKYPNDLISHVNDKTEKVFCDYNIRPVMLKKGNTTPDYFENKHLYFIKLLNGNISKAW